MKNLHGIDTPEQNDLVIKKNMTDRFDVDLISSSFNI